MQTITIRRLGPEDLTVLQNVAEDVFDNPVDMKLAKAYLAAPHMALWVALEGDLVVGMASAMIYWHPDKPREGWVNEVGVAPSHQRQGIATRLMGAVLDWAKAEGLVSLWLATETDNGPARALYRSLDGREDAEVVYFGWLDG
ncbi:MAG: GNAT family N-acetyltransferase [Pseudomonadota bacterium]